MKVSFKVSNQDGLAYGIEPGEHTVDVPVASLSAEDRASLARVLGGGNTLNRASVFSGLGIYINVCTPRAVTAQGVVDAVRATEAAVADKIASLRREADEAIAKLAKGEAAYYNGDLAEAFPDLKEAEVAARARAEDAAIAEARPKIERLLAQGRLDIAQYQSCYKAVEHNLGIVRTALEKSGDWSRLYQAACSEADRLTAEAEAAKAARDAAALAARDAWLREHGENAILAKLDAGYNCAGAIRAAVRRLVTEQVEALAQGVRVLAADDECTSCKDRSCPSDAAFALEQACDVAGLDAGVVWATWEPAEDAYGEDPRHAELVRIVVPCPWDDRVKDYVALEVTGDGFSD